MFIGMEHIVLSNYAQADESLNAANAMCDGDPLLINERGVMAFNHGRCFPPTTSLDQFRD
jgi:anaphase-promoting complex subunit 6